MTIHENTRNGTNQKALFVPLRVISWIVFALQLTGAIALAAPETSIDVSLNRTRPQRGETVEISVRVPQSNAPVNGPIHGLLLQPTKGTLELTLQKVSVGEYKTEIPLGLQAPEGMYVVHVWTGEASKPAAVGKATFLLGQVVADFF